MFQTGTPSQADPRRRFTRRTLGAAAYAAILLGCASWAYRPAIRFLRKAEGHVILLDESHKTVALANAGDAAKVAFSVQNAIDRDVVIYGMTSTCACASASNLPLTIPAGQRRELLFHVSTSPKETRGRLSQEARLFLEPASPPVVLQINVELAKPAPIPSASGRPAR